MTRNRAGRPKTTGAPLAAVWGYNAALAALLVPLTWMGLRLWPDVDLLPTVILAAMGVLGASVREREIDAQVGISFGSIVLVAAVGLVGPAGAAVVGVVSYLAAVIKQPFASRAFNALMIGVAGAVGGLVYHACGGLEAAAGADGPASLLTRVGLPLMAADVCLAIANALILAGVVRLTRGTPMRAVAGRMLSTSGLSYVGYGVIGFLFVVLWGPGEVGVFSAVLILAPLFVARWVYRQYGDERRAHERTLGSMITAAEVNDIYTRGHGQRVAALAGLMARELGMGHQRTDALRSAALLHDVGMIGVRASVLTQSAALDLDDLAQIQRHPQLGVEMVEGIDFLHESVDGIRHHHERFDGLGYPDGLAGHHIPEFSRIIAVADAFDSMTTTRSYRPALSLPEALRTLRERAGSHLDPVCVEALERGLEGQQWATNQIDDATLARAGNAHDHDDPAVSDLMAERADELRARAAEMVAVAREQVPAPAPAAERRDEPPRGSRHSDRSHREGVGPR